MQRWALISMYNIVPKWYNCDVPTFFDTVHGLLQTCNVLVFNPQMNKSFESCSTLYLNLLYCLSHFQQPKVEIVMNKTKNSKPHSSSCVAWTYVPVPVQAERLAVEVGATGSQELLIILVYILGWARLMALLPNLRAGLQSVDATLLTCPARNRPTWSCQSESVSK